MDQKDWRGGNVDKSGSLNLDGIQSGPQESQGPAVLGSGSRYINTKAYLRLTTKSIEKWLEKIRHETPAPNASQLQYLEGVIGRCKREAEELHGKVAKCERNSEPSRECLLGPPGCGKSECLKWTIRFFQECLGWEHGVQYQCLASQN